MRRATEPTVQHIEVESKFELSEAAYDRIKSLASLVSTTNQLNVYYDSAWRLADASATFRVRSTEDDIPVLTLKCPINQQGAKRVMREFEVELGPNSPWWNLSLIPDTIEAADLPADMADAVRALGLERLERVGMTKNRRLVLDAHGIGTFELDWVRLPDGSILHEAEVESEDVTTHAAIFDWIRQQAPGAKPSLLSKFQRFREAASAAR